MRVVRRYLKELWLFIKHIDKLWYFYREFGDGLQLTDVERDMIGAVSRYPWKIIERPNRSMRKVLYRSGTFNIGLFQRTKDTEIMYVNGICTSLETAKLETSLLSKEIRKPITLAYNESRGFWEDLYDCARMRVRNRSDRDSDSLVRWIVGSFDLGIRTFVLIGYSQGSIIVCHAMNDLPRYIKASCTFEILTFGAAQDELKPFPEGTATHVGHEKDFIARTGVIEYHRQGKIYGQLVIDKQSDHNIFEYVATMRNEGITSAMIDRLNKK